MKTKYELHILFPAVLLIGIAVSPVRAQATLGAKEISMGQAVTALPNSNWSVFSNPAMMTKENRNVSFFGIRYYGLENLTDMAMAVSYPTGIGVIGGGAYRFGDDLYNESRLRVGYKNSYQGFHYGIAVNYYHVSQGGGHGSLGTAGIDVGIAARLWESLWIGAKAGNINQPKYGRFNNIAEEPVRDLSLGFAYKVSNLLMLSSDVYKDVRFPISYRGGMEIVIYQAFAGRLGVTTKPLTFAAGFGYGTDLWSINLVAQRHENPVLGISPGIDLNISW